MPPVPPLFAARAAYLSPMVVPVLLAQLQVAVPAESREVRLRNIRQLIFGGQNAEAYFSRTTCGSFLDDDRRIR